MINKIKSILCGVIIAGMNQVYAQEAVPTVKDLKSENLNWYNLDPENDNKQGVGVSRLYNEKLNNMSPKKKVVVAIIDSGIDIFHEDLKDKIWVNKDEIADNGIDDDKNGYVDDINGWNFLGNAKGENINYETYEYIRIYRNLKPQFESVTSADGLSQTKKKDYETYLKCKKRFDEDTKKYAEEKKLIDQIDGTYVILETIISAHLGKKEFTIDEVKAITSTDERISQAKGFYLEFREKGVSKAVLKEEKERIGKMLKKQINLEFDPRKIIADNIEDINDNKYGNNNVKGPDSFHGTFVAGIIGAKRNNDLGVDGIASNVELMVLRSVPNGDEYDKDIALSIRYAVDNGADIINMSFGKGYSPQKKLVDDAIKYAEDNNVLLVHAAGNDASDVDKTPNFPNPKFLTGASSKNMLTIGASTISLDEGFPASFTNYGKKGVDFFAPGHDIISLYPENKYKMASGTSFASPVVAGVAALVLSYFPDLTALELREILVKSVTKYKKLKVNYPSQEKKTKLSKLCNTGGMINAYKAFELAEKKSGKSLKASVK